MMKVQLSRPRAGQQIFTGAATATLHLGFTHKTPPQQIQNRHAQISPARGLCVFVSIFSSVVLRCVCVALRCVLTSDTQGPSGHFLCYQPQLC